MFSQEHHSLSVSDPSQLHSSTKFKIALCQLVVNPDKKVNLASTRSAIRSAVEGGASLVVLPEMWNCPFSDHYFEKNAENFDNLDSSSSLSMLSEAARSHRITIIGGSVPELANAQLYNTCCVFGADGKLKGRHRKVHLFDIDIPGEISFKESDTFFAGNEPTVVDTDIGRIGIGICHDIRFPELAMLYKEKGVDMICYPGAFNISTGELFWELEQRARAVDNQLFVATCSPARESSGSYEIWGHSTVVGPSGEVIATAGHEEAIVFAEIDFSENKRQREMISLDKQRRGDIFQFVNVHERASIPATYGN